MDCFYAAIELRERPELRGQPVAVGGRRRGVLTTCNYEARKYGCRSAMPTFQAMRLCPDLVVLPVRFDFYRAESRKIRAIFAEFTDLIEPLSLDEAYLDVSHLASEGAAVAAEIRARIRETTGLTASAGIAPNKFLAKVASDWRKPDGQFEVTAEILDEFVRALPVEKIWGVGKRTAEKIHAFGARTCGELQGFSLVDLDRRFGKFGHELHDLCRGVDHRRVNPNRERKSVSNERTFFEDVRTPEAGLEKLKELEAELREDLARAHAGRRVREAVVKLKFEDFTQTTAQRAVGEVDSEIFEALLREAWERGGGKAVRLIGAGVRFFSEEDASGAAAERAGQMEMF
ncbi:MAG: DNA polymerase IV [Akkermansiaceae bacterium]|nr:DNA polymerase IV [Akkermansiaceae bacterium]MCP5551529.1 DNA polymerase IV [Akkermansiaceae bacterium]